MNCQMSISTDNTLVSLLTFFYEKGLSLRILIVLSKTGFELEKHIKFITIKHTSLSFFKSMCELNGNIYDYIFSRKKNIFEYIFNKDLFKSLSCKHSIFNSPHMTKLHVCNLKRYNHIQWRTYWLIFGEHLKCEWSVSVDRSPQR